MKRVSIDFDNKSGRSLGTGHVVFTSKKDAVSAIRRYNGERLDGRPLQVCIIAFIIIDLNVCYNGT